MSFIPPLVSGSDIGNRAMHDRPQAVPAMHLQAEGWGQCREAFESYHQSVNMKRKGTERDPNGRWRVKYADVAGSSNP